LDLLGQAMVNSAARAIGSQVGRQLIRGALGSLLGGSSQRWDRYGHGLAVVGTILFWILDIVGEFRLSRWSFR
jgi:hypothetical protein